MKYFCVIVVGGNSDIIKQEDKMLKHVIIFMLMVSAYLNGSDLIKDFKVSSNKPLSSIAFSPDGKFIASGGCGALYLYNIK